MIAKLVNLVRTEFGKEHILRHGERVAELAVQLSKCISQSISEKDLYFAAQFHDIGKILIRESILKKPDALTEFEFLMVKLHPIHTYQIIKNFNVPENAAVCALYHHENYDGTGYNYKLVGENIPLGARIIRICDFFDAITNQRPYNQILNVSDAIKLMDTEREKLDPDLYSKFKHFIVNYNNNKLREEQII